MAIRQNPVPYVVAGVVGVIAFLGVTARRKPGGGITFSLPTAAAATHGTLAPNFPWWGRDAGTTQRRKTYGVRGFRKDLETYAREVARANGIPEEGFAIQLFTESGMRPDIGSSSAGALGIAQFMPNTGVEYDLVVPGVGKAAYIASLQGKSSAERRALGAAMLADPATVDERASNPRKAIRAAARLMKRNHSRFNNWAQAAGAYNAGAGRVRQNRALPEETQRYMAIVAPYYGETLQANAQVSQAILDQYTHPLQPTVVLRSA